MRRSLVQTGSSLAVTLPMEVVQTFGLRKGQEVEVTVHPVTGVVSIRPGIALVDQGRVGEPFRAIADEVFGRRAGLIGRLGR
jgi:hypothetical protein